MKMILNKYTKLFIIKTEFYNVFRCTSSASTKNVTYTDVMRTVHYVIEHFIYHLVAHTSSSPIHAQISFRFA